MTTQILNIPNPPDSAQDAIECLTALGQALKLTINTMEANPEWFPNTARTLARAHRELNSAGYLLEDMTGQPDGTYGAGGSNKSGGGGGG